MRREKKIPIITETDKEAILAGEVALITGGSSGIGLAIAKSFLASGAKVIICGTSQRKLEIAKNDINHEHLYTVGIDITHVSSLASRIEEIAQQIGDINILVNSAGKHHHLDFEKMTEEEFDDIMKINVKGTYFMCQAFIKYMRRHKIKGHILNISSSSGLRPAINPYQLSKWAINGLTKGLAKECYKDGIIVNAIAPGQTATPMLGVEKDGDISNGFAFSGRYIMPEEVASLATFMCSKRGDMIVGDTVYMSGGSGICTFEG